MPVDAFALSKNTTYTQRPGEAPIRAERADVLASRQPQFDGYTLSINGGASGFRILSGQTDTGGNFSGYAISDRTGQVYRWSAPSFAPDDAQGRGQQTFAVNIVSGVDDGTPQIDFLNGRKMKGKVNINVARLARNPNQYGGAPVGMRDPAQNFNPPGTGGPPVVPVADAVAAPAPAV